MTTIVSRINSMYTSGEGTDITVDITTDRPDNIQLTIRVSLADIASASVVQMNNNIRNAIEAALLSQFGISKGSDGHMFLGGVV